MTSYLHPTREAGRAFIERGLTGPVVMLNMLKLRDVADYSASPELAPTEPISGAEAYDRYVEAVTPMLQAAGGDLVFTGTGGAMLIGPVDESWDRVLLVRHKDPAAFLAFATDESYLAVAGHRTAALLDSRLLPMIEASAE